MAFGDEYESALKQGGNFKPTAGSYKIIVLGEPVETEYIEKEGTKDEKRNPQYRLEIECDKKQHTWFVPKGKTAASVSIQLMALKKHNLLIGKPFTLVVKTGNDNKKDFTIIEALELIKADKEKLGGN